MARLATCRSIRAANGAAAAIGNLAANSAEGQYAVWADAVPPLVGCLRGDDSDDPVLRWSSAAALHNIARANRDQQAALLAAGAATAATQALQSADPMPQTMAATLLRELAATAASVPCITEAGAVPQLVKLLSPSCGAEMHCVAAGALANLSPYGAAADQVVAAGGVAALLGLLHHSSGMRGQAAEAADAALLTLGSVMCGHTEQVAAEGGAAAIAAQLSRPCSFRVWLATTLLLHNIACQQPQLMDAATAAAATRGLVQAGARALGSSEEQQVHAAVMEALVSICRSSRLNEDAAAEAQRAVMHSSTDSRVLECARRVGSLMCLRALADARQRFNPAAQHG